MVVSTGSLTELGDVGGSKFSARLLAPGAGSFVDTRLRQALARFFCLVGFDHAYTRSVMSPSSSLNLARIIEH